MDILSSDESPVPISPKIRFGWIAGAWQLLMAQSTTWIVANLIFGLIVFALSFLISTLGRAAGYYPAADAMVSGFSFHALITQTFGAPFAPFKLIGSIPTLLATGFLYAGIYGIAVEQIRGNPVGIGMMFSGGRRFLSMLGYLFIVWIGSTVIFDSSYLFGLKQHSDTDLLLSWLCALVVNALLYPFFLPGYALIADGRPLIDSLRQSVSVVAKDPLSAIVFGIMLVIVSMIGALACGVGALLTLPLAYIVPALMYRDMIGLPMGPRPPQPDLSQRAPLADEGVWPPAPGSSDKRLQ